MPEFRYEGFSQLGGQCSGLIETEDENTARSVLREQGIVVIDLKRRRIAFPELGNKSTLNEREIAQFFRDLALLLNASVPLNSALSAIGTEDLNHKSQNTLHFIRQKIEGGLSLSDALLESRSGFSDEIISAVKAGEISGQMGRTLTILADMLQKRIEASQKIRSALAYPIFLLGISGIALTIVTTVLIPSLAPFLIESGKELPIVMKILVFFNQHIEDVTFALLCVLIIGLVFWFALRRNPVIRRRFDRKLLNLPWLGGIFRESDTVRYTGTLGALLAANVSLLSAMESARTAVQNREIYSTLESATQSVAAGIPLDEALLKTGALQTSFIRMILIGAKSGNVSESLLRISHILEAKLSRRLDQFISLIGPVMTIFVAFLVGGLLFTVLNAVLSIDELVSQ